MKYFTTEKFEIEHDYDVVLIVGNGLDLNLGVKTGYCDFIKSEHFKKLIQRNNELAVHLSVRNGLENWIDIENELKNYSSIHKGSKPNFFSEFKDLSDALVIYLKDLKIDIDKSTKSYKLIKEASKHISLILDFNYTSTIQKILTNIEDTGSKLTVDHVKIHGCLDKNNIIFGVEDTAGIFRNDIFLKKSVNKNFQAVDFSDIIKSCHNFMIFGHSLGETDHMYFEDYFRNSVVSKNDNEEVKKISIYYYGEDSYYQLFAQIDNLTSKRITKFRQYNVVDLIDTKC